MVLVVGGQHRKVGKTSVITALIRALPAAEWVAVKITPHHAETGWVLERTADLQGDSGRYLEAGAVEAWYLRCTPQSLVDSIPSLNALIRRARNIVIESNSVIDHLTPDMQLTVIDDRGSDQKESFERTLATATAIVSVNSGDAAKVQGKPTFFVTCPSFESRELARFVEKNVT